MTNPLLALILVMSMVAFSAPQPIEAATVVNLVLLSANATVKVNDTFDIIVQAKAGSQEVDSAAIFLDFDPTKLAVQSITNGPSLGIVIDSTYDNSAGTVDHSVGTFSAFPTGTFGVATVTFRALAVDAGTAISFHAVPVRQTDVARAGSSVLNTIKGTRVTITPGEPVSITVTPDEPISITVAPGELVSIAVTPVAASIVLGETQQFTAIGIYTSGTAEITNSVSWASHNPSVATVDATGLATSLAAGTTAIIATLSVIDGTTTLTVTEAETEGIIAPSAESGITDVSDSAGEESVIAEEASAESEGDKVGVASDEGTTTVKAPPPKPTNWWLIGGIIAGVVVVGVIIWLALKRRIA